MNRLTYVVHSGWRLLLADMGGSPSRVLRRAGLPEDLFARVPCRVGVEAYHALWSGVAEEDLQEPAPVCFARALSAEVFDPPIFAALCSPNLQHAAARIADFKPLIGPMTLRVASGEGCLKLDTCWPGGVKPPAVLGAAEVLFWVALARMGTRSAVMPLGVEFAEAPDSLRSYASYLGITPTIGRGWSVTFSEVDAQRVFLTDNEGMWRVFEPELRRQLADLEQRVSTGDRVQAALLKQLPAGRSDMAGVAKALGLSSRTLQRRLLKEKTSFQGLLATTRAALARHYLRETEYGVAEISYLLGYHDPNSFFRAFQTWTDQTPDQFRRAARA